MVSTTRFAGRRIAALTVASLVAATLTLSGAFAQNRPQQAPAQGQATPAAQPQPAQPPAPPFPNLQALIQKNRDAERKINADREAKFAGELRKAEENVKTAIARRTAAEGRSAQLDKAFAANEQRIAEVNQLLKQQSGNLGELFGVTRQVAGDAASVLQDSLLTSQFKKTEEGEERHDFLVRLAGAKELPALPELTRLWQELLREMVESGKVVAYKADIIQQDESVKENVDVVRVGPFTVVADGRYLAYIPGKKSLAELPANLQAPYPSYASALQNAVGQQGYVQAVVDPARGSIIGLFLDRPSWFKRIENGESINYVILAVGGIGLLLALIQAAYLILTRLKVNSQLKSLNSPKADNPLGRVLLAARRQNRTDTAEVVELRISEAVLRELPSLERYQAFLRLAVSAGPLLGLIGTVVGMIITFRVIVASGTSDPKMMATGISTAMIATVLGLGIAIPLLFINSWLGNLSRKIIEVLDEESQAALARSALEGK